MTIGRIKLLKYFKKMLKNVKNRIWFLGIVKFSFQNEKIYLNERKKN